MKNQTATFHVLRSFLEARASFSGQELEFVEAMFVPSSLRANEFLSVPALSRSTRRSSQRAVSGSTSSTRMARSTSCSSLRRPGGWLTYLGVSPETISRIRRKAAGK